MEAKCEIGDLKVTDQGKMGRYLQNSQTVMNKGKRDSMGHEKLST